MSLLYIIIVVVLVPCYETAQSCPKGTGNCVSRNNCPNPGGEIVTCPLSNTTTGICCVKKNGPPQNEQRKNISLTQISQTDVNQAVAQGQANVQTIANNEAQLKPGSGLAVNGSSEAFQANFFGSNPVVINISRNGAVLLNASAVLVQKFQLDPISARDGLFFKSQQVNLDFNRGHVPPEQNPCRPESDYVCTQTRYRSADGSCNNLNHGMWGRSFILFERLLLQDYSNGIDAIRLDINANPLPNPRLISKTFAQNVNAPNSFYTLMVMQMGQFIDHDLTQTAGSSPFIGYNAALDCCTSPINVPECLPISIPSGDLFYGPLNVTCMNFVRSANGQCQLGAREQINQITAYLDSSNIYGSTPSTANSLRTLTNGLMKTSIIQSREGCPFDPSSSGCNIPNPNQKCFLAGDTRVNEQTELSFLHTIWLREHNRIARKLKIIHSSDPSWNDEKLYQESRRIVNAEYQHIIYNEFLPAIIGPDIISDSAYIYMYDLVLTTSGYSSGYADYINAGIVSSFATAGYRLHSLIQGFFETRTNMNALIQKYQLRTQFNNPQILYNLGSIEGIASGLSGQPVQSEDNCFTEEITEHLFQQSPNTFGLDLVALNIQRGRDHGLPSYNEFRSACLLPKVTDWTDLGNYMDPTVANLLKTVYVNVDDIDLFVGGSAEFPASTIGLVGPTFGCIISEQFRRLKNGDTFWYENGGILSSLTPSQLTEIKKASLARVLCDNSAVGKIQPKVMQQVSPSNSKLACSDVSIGTIDLTAF